MLRTSLPVRTGRTALQRTVFLGLLFAAVFFLPYLITPQRTISRSYVAGYSNRTAVIIFLLGTGLFGWFTGGRISRLEGKNGRLSWSALAVGMLVSLLACLYGSRWPPWQIPGGESLYFLNRQQLLAAGRIPYKQFEFGYGPLLLYPSLWAQRMLHSSALRGYMVAWVVECLLGTVMVWVVVRLLDLRVPSRVLLFGFLLLSQLVWLDLGGLSYTALRGFCAAFCIAITHAVWTRTRSPWWTASCCVGSVVFSMACSVDQAVGVAFGLNVYMLLLSLHRRWKFPAGPLVLSVAGSLGCFVAADYWGMLLTMKTFGSGGYSYPVLPSPSIILALFAYVMGGCALYRRLSLGRLDSIIVPLTLGGIAMIPAALGRSDMLHIASATPLFVVGVAAIFAMPLVRRWWLPLAALGLIALPPAFVRKDAILDELSSLVPSASDWADRESDILVPSQNQWYVSATQLPESALPCDRRYFSPSFMPLPLEAFHLSCLDTGYYVGFTNVSTPATIEDKIEELRRHAALPLLMENIPLEDQIPLQLVSMDSLHVESGSFWVPPQRHAPLTYVPLIEYIQRHYVPGAVLAGGSLQIWNPRPIQ